MPGPTHHRPRPEESPTEVIPAEADLLTNPLQNGVSDQPLDISGGRSGF